MEIFNVAIEVYVSSDVHDHEPSLRLYVYSAGCLRVSGSNAVALTRLVLRGGGEQAALKQLIVGNEE